MTRSIITEDQIICVLQEQKAGSATVDVCRQKRISPATFDQTGTNGLTVTNFRRVASMWDVPRAGGPGPLTACPTAVGASGYARSGTRSRLNRVRFRRRPSLDAGRLVRTG